MSNTIAARTPSSPRGRGFLFIAGPDMGNSPVQGFARYLPVKKDDGIKGLPLSGRRYLPFHRQVGKKTLHIPDAKEMSKAHYPLAAGLLGAAGIMMIAQNLA